MKRVAVYATILCLFLAIASFMPGNNHSGCTGRSIIIERAAAICPIFGGYLLMISDGLEYPIMEHWKGYKIQFVTSQSVSVLLTCGPRNVVLSFNRRIMSVTMTQDYMLWTTEGC